MHFNHQVLSSCKMLHVESYDLNKGNALKNEYSQRQNTDLCTVNDLKSWIIFTNYHLELQISIMMMIITKIISKCKIENSSQKSIINCNLMYRNLHRWKYTMEIFGDVSLLKVLFKSMPIYWEGIELSL